MIAVFLHIYYPDSLAGLLKEVDHLLTDDTYLFINLVRETHFSIPPIEGIKNVVVISAPNKGKDIGGKLALLDVYLKMGVQADIMVFLHDKRSPHSTTGTFWKSELYKIISKENTERVRVTFESKKDAGIIASKIFIKDEWDATSGRFLSTNHNELTNLLKEYKLKVKDHSFVAGTMFWIRSSIFVEFFSRHSATAIRATLETGNVLDYDKGSITHAWERMLSWIATDKGYKLVGI